MEAYAIVEHGQPLEKLSLPTPVPTGREVLVAVTHSGICHSDLHLIEGNYDLGSRGSLNLAMRGLKLPLIPGHEIVGNIVSWGTEADGEGLTAGDVRLLGLLLTAERDRIPSAEAEQRLLSDDAYASPFLAMPF